LELAGEFAPILPGRAVHLAERRRRGRFAFEFCVFVFQFGPSSAAIRRLTNGQPIDGAFDCR
jgi:hypothetical protein